MKVDRRSSCRSSVALVASYTGWVRLDYYISCCCQLQNDGMGGGALNRQALHTDTRVEIELYLDAKPQIRSITTLRVCRLLSKL